ncbi:TRAP transporter small permease subunit [Salipiger mucosus]|uniref:TRAP transporter small permease protein n=1 Tax=Salipiger mucosus DSM 16094 TaxID=1123237 RepID=S9S2J8_9RHOB|nr:TRAP transporter small permease subunit [Salipiger mucosus]EPX80419.1 TRAP-type transport system, small permease component, predicted N-acetylneuraminate transporter [Salipiger mucosus DSM 16094]
MEQEAATGGVAGTILDAVIGLIGNIFMSFYNLGYALTHPASWLNWSDPEAVMRFVYYGGSAELFFVVLTIFLVLTGIGMWRHKIMWGMVRGLEALHNSVGRVAAWAGLLMVLQQVVIIFIQRIFARPDIGLGFGIPLSFDVSWWSEELKLYNAMVVALCLAYTFVQGGHVRVDLLYSPARYRVKKAIDMFGSLVFMLPMATLMWLYSWFFLWRHLIVPKPSASEGLDRLLMKSRALRWNVETIGFSPNGFSAYFLFKILIVVMCAFIFLQGVTFFWRSYLEWKEGEESDGKYLDHDRVEAGEEAYDHAEF